MRIENVSLRDAHMLFGAGLDGQQLTAGETHGGTQPPDFALDFACIERCPVNLPRSVKDAQDMADDDALRNAAPAPTNLLPLPFSPLAQLSFSPNPLAKRPQ